jgi:hypothetical protein
MVKLRYIGQVEKTLIDVAALSNGVEFDVDEVFATRLLEQYPNDYETVSTSSRKKSKDETTDAVAVDDSTNPQV